MRRYVYKLVHCCSRQAGDIYGVLADCVYVGRQSLTKIEVIDLVHLQLFHTIVREDLLLLMEIFTH